MKVRNTKKNILSINWKKDDIEKLKTIKENIGKNRKTTIFIKGKEKYINTINKNIENINHNNNNIKIINCYDIQEVGDNLERIMSQYNKILNTSGEKEIEKL